jgi:c-di-GMP-related signal transduction protein
MRSEKVENHAEFVAARDQGFLYFQGSFLCLLRRPEMMTRHDVPAKPINYMRILEAVPRPELDVPELDQLIKTEASICYRLLRYMNSARFGFRHEIHSVCYALAILGDHVDAGAREWRAGSRTRYLRQPPDGRRRRRGLILAVRAVGPWSLRRV